MQKRLQNGEEDSPFATCARFRLIDWRLECASTPWHPDVGSMRFHNTIAVRLAVPWCHQRVIIYKMN